MASLRCILVCVCVCVSPFPRCLRAEGPSVGLLLSLLRGPQRLLIIPDLLALPLSASHSRPLWLSQVSSLPMHSFFALFAPLHVQNNPSARLLLLIAAISETKTCMVRGNPEGQSRRRASITPACLSRLGGCLESHCFDRHNSLFQGVPFVEKSDASKPVITARQRTGGDDVGPDRIAFIARH